MAPAWGGVLGSALTTGANAYLRTVLNEPDERIARRKSELEVEDLEGKVESGRREAAAGGKPIATAWGIYTIDPTTRRYKLELPRPEQARKPFAKEAELEMMLEWSSSEDPYKRDIARSYLDKQQAPGRQADIRSRQADAQVQHLQKQESYWQSRADEAKRHNSAMEGIYRRKAQQVSGELGSLMQAQQWLESGTPEQQEAAGRYLQGKDIKLEQAGVSLEAARSRLEQLKTRSELLEPKLKADLEYRLEQLKQLELRGLHLGPYLEAQLKRLEEQVRASEARRSRGSGTGSEVSVPHGAFGPTTRYRGVDVDRYYEAFAEATEQLGPLSEKDATEAVSRQPPGPKRDGYLEAWRGKFPGKVFKPTQGIVPFPDPRRRGGRRGAEGRESAIRAPDTALDTLAVARFGKKYLELDDEQKQEVEAASGVGAPAPPVPDKGARATPPAQTGPPQTTPPAAPGSVEQRAYTAYRAGMIDVPHEQVTEAWEEIKKSGTEDHKRAFRRAYREHFGGELR